LLWPKGKRTVCVKPVEELAQFFRLSYDCQKEDIAGHPEGLPGLLCNTPSMPFLTRHDLLPEY
jgi:hypothetical protein